MSLIKVCYERIIPAAIDPLGPRITHTKGLMELRTSKNLGRELSASEIAHIDRMALVDSKKWESGDTLDCQFLDGSSKMRRKVEDIAHEWEEHANIKLNFIETGLAEIRISFYADKGSWSGVGLDILVDEYFPIHQPTMNYGWLRDDTKEEEFRRVTLHEFGHALGCIHEHQSPTFDRKWNLDLVMEIFTGPPNYWSEEAINHNVLQKYSPEGISATHFDPESIMLYAFDGALFSDNLGPTNMNNGLSEKDKEMIGKLYPKYI